MKENNCSLTQYCYLELLYNIHCQISSNELTNKINKYINNILKNVDKITIGIDDLTRILTRLIIRLENIEIQLKLFLFVEQTRTELCFIETLLLENNLSLFENNIRQWITDLLLTMDLFNEQLYTKACELLFKMIDKTHNYERLTRRIVELIEKLRRLRKVGLNLERIRSFLVGLILKLYPLGGSSIDIHPNARWQQNGITVAGGNREDNGTNQLSSPWDLYVDDDQTIYVADTANHRIVEWKWGATSGQVVAGGNGQGSGDHQLSSPLDMIVDKESDSLIISDYANRRVVRWSRRNGTSGETIISNINCLGLTMDENGSLYVVDTGKDEVRRYRRGESQGIVVAGGNGGENHLDQLSSPRYVFVDQDHSVYVSDYGNDRVMKWIEGAKQGIVVAGGQGKGDGLTQLSSPQGVVVDPLGTVYVADWGNDRIMRWPQGATQGSVIVGGNGKGGQSNQLNWPIGLSFDRDGNLYVVDLGNDRVQKFNIESNNDVLQVKIETGDELFAGTNSHVSLILRSGNGVICQVYDLDNIGNDRERNSVDEYTICCSKDFFNDDDDELSMLAVAKLTRSGKVIPFFSDD
ncbi:unnamed protein product [Rotaria sp. Silwood1]|nr:unnamed protein product [Rotaria sp. Silwood1]